MNNPWNRISVALIEGDILLGTKPAEESAVIKELKAKHKREMDKLDAEFDEYHLRNVGRLIQGEATELQAVARHIREHGKESLSRSQLEVLEKHNVGMDFWSEFDLKQAE